MIDVRYWIRFLAAAAIGTIPLHQLHPVIAQAPNGQAAVNYLYAAPPSSGTATLLPTSVDIQPKQTARQRPLARLVRNPNASDGLPPFALTDQAGTIHRYVEPVPGIDLEAFVNQVVTVRHDTGRTLLASQLELPTQPLHSLIEDPTVSALHSYAPSVSGAGSLEAIGSQTVKPAQFIDNDDSTVQLLPEGDATPSDTDLSSGSVPPLDQSDISPVPQHNGDGFSGPLLPTETEPMGPVPIISPLLSESMIYGPEGAGTQLGAPFGMEVCPECGGRHSSDECDPVLGTPFGPIPVRRSKPCTMFADFEINFLRTHIAESRVEKLSETYQFSPRVIVGFRDTEKLDGRVRYWHYGRDTGVLGERPVRLEFDVWDIEGTHSFAGKRSEVTLSAGLRLAAIDLIDNEDEKAGSDLIGMTLAAEGRAPLCSFRRGRFFGVYGARLSLLGGDWGSHPDSDFVGGLVRDDNVVVHELHAGFDYAFRYRDLDLHGRLGFEMQNWHSDALSQHAGTDSIGFLGPGLQIGAEF